MRTCTHKIQAYILQYNAKLQDILQDEFDQLQLTNVFIICLIKALMTVEPNYLTVEYIMVLSLRFKFDHCGQVIAIDRLHGNTQLWLHNTLVCVI